MSGGMVECARCKVRVPVAETEVSLEGELCAKCALGHHVERHLGGKQQSADEIGRSILSTAYKKHLFLGGSGLVFGFATLIPLIWLAKEGIFAGKLWLAPALIIPAAGADFLWGLRGMLAHRAKA